MSKSNFLQHPCLCGKAAWILGLRDIVYKNIYILFYILFIYSPPLRYPVYVSTLLRLLRLIGWGKYHNAVATAVAGKKVANV